MNDDRDWSWLTSRSERLAAPTPVETRLWTVTKDTRRAELLVRPHPAGQELRCVFNGSFLWSETFRHGDGVRLGEVAEQHLSAWIAKGWSVEP